jgi:hypothetical protein
MHRAAVIDLMVALHGSSNCSTGSLFLAVSLFDRYLASRETLSKKAMLTVSSAALLAAGRGEGRAGNMLSEEDLTEEVLKIEQEVAAVFGKGIPPTSYAFRYAQLLCSNFFFGKIPCLSFVDWLISTLNAVNCTSRCVDFSGTFASRC